MSRASPPNANSVDQRAGLQAQGEPLDTAEVRWFADGALPRSFVEWFSDMGRSGVVETRSDIYRVGDAPDVGLKRRDYGPLELKIRRGSGGVLSIGGGVHGRIEEWRKTGAVESTRVRGDRDWQWSAVDKMVLTRTFAMDHRDGIAEVTGTDPTEPACDIELASVVVGETVAWTFAFEAWGPREARRRMLAGSLAALTSQSSPIPYRLVAALQLNMGYPEWLASTVWSDRVVAQ